MSTPSHRSSVPDELVLGKDALQGISQVPVVDFVEALLKVGVADGEVCRGSMSVRQVFKGGGRLA